MVDKKDQRSLSGLDLRLKEARGKEKQIHEVVDSVPQLSGKGLGFRIGTELVVATAVAGCIGYYLDIWLDTKPWLLVLFLILGNISGIWNIYRLIQNHGYSVGFKEKEKNALDK